MADANVAISGWVWRIYFCRQMDCRKLPIAARYGDFATTMTDFLASYASHIAVEQRIGHFGVTSALFDSSYFLRRQQRDGGSLLPRAEMSVSRGLV
jgi:hypothetical protein